MKKYILLSFILTGVFCRAQVYIGVHSGVSLPHLQSEYDNKVRTETRTAFGTGLFADFPFLEIFHFQPELDFSPQGGSITGMQQIRKEFLPVTEIPADSILYADIKTKILLDYLEVPLLFKVTFGKKFIIGISMGPSVSFLLKAKTKVTGAGSLYFDKAGNDPVLQSGVERYWVVINNSKDCRNTTREINVAMIGGFSMQYPAGPGFICLESRMSVGAVNVQIRSNNDERYKTGSIQFNLGYSVRLNKRK